MNYIVITHSRNATYETITFPNEKLKDIFLKKIYFNNSEIPPDASLEQLERIAQRVLHVTANNTYISLGVSKRSLKEVFGTYKNEENPLGAVELNVELDNIPLIFKRDDYAKIYNIKVNAQNVRFVTSNTLDDDDIEELKRCAFAYKLERIAEEMFED